MVSVVYQQVSALSLLGITICDSVALDYKPNNAHQYLRFTEVCFLDLIMTYLDANDFKEISSRIVPNP